MKLYPNSLQSWFLWYPKIYFSGLLDIVCILILLTCFIQSPIYSWENCSFKKVWGEAKPAYEEIIKHPFVQEMVSGKLPSAKYLHYLQQDAFYLIQDAATFKLLAELACSPFEKNYLLQIAQSMEKPIPEMYQKYVKDFDDLRLVYECELYTSYLWNAAKSGNYYYAIGCAMACIVSYGHIAHDFFNIVTPKNPYYHWFEKNNDDLTEDIEFINYILQKADEVQYQDFLNGFMIAMIFESVFWDGSYSIGS